MHGYAAHAETLMCMAYNIEVTQGRDYTTKRRLNVYNDIAIRQYPISNANRLEHHNFNGNFPKCGDGDPKWLRDDKSAFNDMMWACRRPTRTSGNTQNTSLKH